MINYIKILLLIALLITCLSACKATAQKDDTPVYSVDGDSTNAKDGNWLTDYKAALAAAQKENKVILVDFTGSDWCGWCKKLEAEVFSQKAFLDYANANLILLKLDFPKSIKQTDELKKQNEDLAKQFAIEGFPTIVLLSKTGEKINQLGYEEGGADKYVEHLKSLIK
jgi:thioredoxin-related protein